MSDALRFVPPRVQLADPRTGMITREWYLFFQGVFDRIGGATGQSSTDLTQDMPDDAGLEEAKALVYSNADAVGQVPQPADLGPLLAAVSDADNQRPPNVERDQTLDLVLAELSAQRDLLNELIKTVQDLQQQPTF